MENRRHALIAAWQVVQALVLTWLVSAILAVLAYMVNIGVPALADIPWQSAARLGVSFWLMALGSPLTVEGASISLMPLAITFVLVFLMRSLLRRNSIGTWLEVGTATATALVVTSILSLTALPGSVRLYALVGAPSLVAALCLLEWARWRQPEGTVWQELREAWRIAKPLIAGVFLAAVSVAVLAAISGWGRMSSITSYYILSLIPTLILAFAQAFYLPNVAVWTVAFMSGAGFCVGSGTRFSSLGSQSEPLPAIPVLGALPQPGQRFIWMIVLLVAIGLAVGLWRGRAYATPRQVLVPGALALALVVVVFAGLGALSAGSIGPDRLAVVGAAPPVFSLVLGLEMGCGLALGLVLATESVREVIVGHLRMDLAGSFREGRTRLKRMGVRIKKDATDELSLSSQARSDVSEEEREISTPLTQTPLVGDEATPTEPLSDSLTSSRIPTPATAPTTVTVATADSPELPASHVSSVLPEPPGYIADKEKGAQARTIVDAEPSDSVSDARQAGQKRS